MPNNKDTKKYTTVAENVHSTVVGQYAPDTKRAEHYQSEDA